MTGTEPMGFSPRVLARVVGVLTLIGILAGSFDLGYVRSKLFVAGDATATVRNILAHETLYNLGLGAHLLLLLCNIGGAIMLFLLLRRVNLVLAGIAMAAALVGTAIEGLDLVAAYVPLRLAQDAGVMRAFSPDQLQALSYLALKLEDGGLLISFVFYGLEEMLEGFLIFRSGFLPRVVGVLLGVAGVCYLTHGLLSFIAPTLDARLFPLILAPCPVGEGLFGIWMATVGLNVAKWTAFVGRGLHASVSRSSHQDAR